MLNKAPQLREEKDRLCDIFGFHELPLPVTTSLRNCEQSNNAIT